MEPSPAPTARSTVRALLPASLGLLAMAVMAASPGSPYQPVLTPNGKPKGPFRDLAVAIGLDRLHGNALLFVSTLVAVGATVAFLLLLRSALRGKVSLRAIAAVVVAAHVVLLFVPLLFSRDVYSYAYYGRIAGIYGGNPYVQTPLDHSGDLLWRFVGPKWVDTPAVYGPAWTSLSAGLSKVLPKPVDHVEIYRYLALAASLAVCALLVGVARRLRPGTEAFALAAFGANPVVLFHSVASGHNDLLVALAVVGALALVVRGHTRSAVAVLALGTLVKATAAIPLVLLLVWVVARAAPERRRRVMLAHAGVAAVLGLAFAVPFLQWQDPTLGMLELAQHEGWLSPSSMVSRWFTRASFGLLGWVPRVVFAAVLLWALVSLGRELWRRAPSSEPGQLAAAWGWGLLLITLMGPVLLPWYVVWALPLVWVLPRVPRGALVVTSALLGVTLWSAEPLRFPGGFDLNLLIGHLVVTPILLLMTWRAVRDLRSRLRVDAPLASGPDPAPAGAEEREPVAAGAAEQ